MLNTTGFPAAESTRPKRLPIREDAEMVDLEADGIKLIDFERQMMKLDQLEDLRMSIGANSSHASEDRKAKPKAEETTVILKELDKARRECAELRKANDQLQRDRLNQTFGKYP